MWLTKLKAALVLENIDQISCLMDEMPLFNTLAEMEEAAFLLHQTKALLERNKLQTAQTMKQLKNTIDFLQSTQTLPPSSINLKF